MILVTQSSEKYCSGNVIIILFAISMTVLKEVKALKREVGLNLCWYWYNQSATTAFLWYKNSSESPDPKEKFGN